MEKKPDCLYLEKKTRLSLHDRFSQVLLEQLTQRKVLFKGNQKSLVLRLRNIPRSQAVSLKGSVWTRLGWGSCWRRGIWNFRNKYRRTCRWCHAPRMRFSPTPKRAAQSGVLKKRRILGQTARQFKRKPLRSRLSGGVAFAAKGRGQQRKAVPTKRELDAELDAYMSQTKSRLDQQLDEYMSLSRSRLDAELDEYMAMAGQSPAWD